MALIAASFRLRSPFGPFLRAFLALLGSAIASLPLQGILVTNYNGYSVAIDGPGFFIVRDPVTGDPFATRRGGFVQDSDGFVVNASGYRLQGYNNTALTTVGDLRVWSPAAVSRSPPMVRSLLAPVVAAVTSTTITAITNADLLITGPSFWFGPDGRLFNLQPDGATNFQGQVLLQQFANPSALIEEIPGVLSLTDDSGPLPRPAPPGTGGLGSLVMGAAEFSDDFQLRIIPPRHPVDPFGIAGHSLITPTGRSTDFALRGRGFFLVRDPIADRVWATRAGAFYLDPDGFLVTQNNFRVQGISDSSQPFDVQFASRKTPGAISDLAVTSIQIDRLGRIRRMLADGTFQAAGRLQLQDFQNPDKLTLAPWNLFGNLTAAGPQYPPTAQPPAVRVQQGALDLDLLAPETLALRSKRREFVQGPIYVTGQTTDLALIGEGFFLVRDPATGERFATRSGAFVPSAEGYLTLAHGLRLQAVLIASDPSAVDLRLSPHELSTLKVNLDGRFTVQGSDGFLSILGYIPTQTFRDPDALTVVQTNLLAGRLPSRQPAGSTFDPPLADHLYGNLAAAVPNPFSTTVGTFSMHQGLLELPPAPEGIPLTPPKSGATILAPSAACESRDATIQISSDLIHWSQLTGPGILQQGAFFTDPTTPVTPKFYRAVLNSLLPTASPWTSPTGR